jgi:hypothetical protein
MLGLEMGMLLSNFPRILGVRRNSQSDHRPIGFVQKWNSDHGSCGTQASNDLEYPSGGRIRMSSTYEKEYYSRETDIFGDKTAN